MYRPQLVKHIKIKDGNGMSRAEIEADLLKDGWSKHDVKDAFYYHDHPRAFSFRKTFGSGFFVTVLIFLIISLFGLTAFLLNSRTLSYSIFLPSAPEINPTALSYGEHQALSNPEFFTKVKGEFIKSKADFVEADLTAMHIKVYKKGEVALEVPIKTKGRDGSWWETPAGLYKIESKEKSHFSSIGHVYQPWSMRFQGNFYIHGWPYYSDGREVSSQFSGGCVRLDTEDSKKVYDLIEVGTPVLVFERDFSSDNFIYKTKMPELSATSFLAADLRNNHVFLSKDSNTEVPIASITKLMTALITTEYINLDSKVTVSKNAIVPTSKPRLYAGQEVSVYNLLFPLLLESSNESAEAIAIHYGKSAFIKHMNDKAKSIGMVNTHFADPSGASAENVSTANDLFMLAKYIYNNRSFIFNITSNKINNNAYGESDFANLMNMNDFSHHPAFRGGKVGKTTAAKETSLTLFELSSAGDKRPVIMIVLGAESRITEGEVLFQSLLKNFD